MYMLTLKEIVKRLKDADLHQVSMETSLHYQQVWRIANGVDKNPTEKTLSKLSDNLMTEAEAREYDKPA